MSVRKDRGIETKLKPGNKFALSLVPESQEKAVMKVCTGRRGDRVLSVSALLSLVGAVGCAIMMVLYRPLWLLFVHGRVMRSATLKSCIALVAC